MCDRDASPQQSLHACSNARGSPVKASFIFDPNKSYFANNELVERDKSKQSSSEISKLLNDVNNTKYSELSNNLHSESNEGIEQSLIWNTNNRSQDTASFVEQCKTLQKTEKQQVKSKMKESKEGVESKERKEGKEIKEGEKLLTYNELKEKKPQVKSLKERVAARRPLGLQISEGFIPMTGSHVPIHVSAGLKLENSPNKPKQETVELKANLLNNYSTHFNTHIRTNSNISDYIQGIEEFRDTETSFSKELKHRNRTIESDQDLPSEVNVNLINSITPKQNTFENSLQFISPAVTPSKGVERSALCGSYSRYMYPTNVSKYYTEGSHLTFNVKDVDLTNRKNIPTEESMDSYSEKMHKQSCDSNTKFRTELKPMSSSFTNNVVSFVNPMKENNFNTISHLNENLLGRLYNVPQQQMTFMNLHHMKRETFSCFTASNYTTYNSSSTGHNSRESNYVEFRIEDYITGKERRTTLMIKNIPNKYDVETLLAEIDQQGMKYKYDCFYLPIDPATNNNKGFAFINFVHPLHIPIFHDLFENRPWKLFNSKKICQIKLAKVQGREEIEKHHANSKHNKKSVHFETSGAVEMEIPFKFYDALKQNFPKIYINKTGVNGVIIKGYSKCDSFIKANN